jgi:hypothetical protein
VRSHCLKPYWGNPNVRNFREGAGNRAMANLNGHEAGNGGYSQGEPKTTAPVLYSTKLLNGTKGNSGEPEYLPEEVP